MEIKREALWVKVGFLQDILKGTLRLDLTYMWRKATAKATTTATNQPSFFHFYINQRQGDILNSFFI